MYSESDFLLQLEKNMRKSEVLTDVVRAILEALNIVDARAKSLWLQIRPSTATILLSEWEKEAGMETRPGYDTKFRQETLAAKEKGVGVINEQVIKYTAESFSNAAVEVTVNTDDSIITIKFVGTIGIPQNMKDLENAIDDIIPAHMEARYEYVYNTWNTVRGMTWNELKAFTWKQVKEGKLNAENT